jgi:hypothetical protein
MFTNQRIRRRATEYLKHYTSVDINTNSENYKFLADAHTGLISSTVCHATRVEFFVMNDYFL